MLINGALLEARASEYCCRTATKRNLNTPELRVIFVLLKGKSTIWQHKQRVHKTKTAVAYRAMDCSNFSYLKTKTNGKFHFQSQALFTTSESSDAAKL